MAKQTESAESIYKVVEVIGTSRKSWDDAARNAVETAASTLRDLRVAEIVKLDMKVEDGKVQAYRARVMLSFKYQS
ncbi:MAG TPA: dodecin family protein [Pyrinomonadaceae bacterium]|nr:dodecin family protein [Pyrinomonadaceae bacterium]